MSLLSINYSHRYARFSSYTGNQASFFFRKRRTTKVGSFASCEFSITPEINHILLLSAKGKKRERERKKKCFTCRLVTHGNLSFLSLNPARKFMSWMLNDKGEEKKNCLKSFSLWSLVNDKRFKIPMNFFYLLLYFQWIKFMLKKILKANKSHLGENDIKKSLRGRTVDTLHCWNASEIHNWNSQDLLLTCHNKTELTNPKTLIR